MKTTFDQLWIGDRFRMNESLWTKIDPFTARIHSRESISLGARGSGYIGDAVCSINHGQEVVFDDPRAAAEADLLGQALDALRLVHSGMSGVAEYDHGLLFRDDLETTPSKLVAAVLAQVRKP